MSVLIRGMEMPKNCVHGYEKLCEYSGYVGLTEDGEEENQ